MINNIYDFIFWYNRCESSCDEGYYGEGCLQKCTCNETKGCNSITGECYMLTTEKRVEFVDVNSSNGIEAVGHLRSDNINSNISGRPPPFLHKYHTFDTTTKKVVYEVPTRSNEDQYYDKGQ